ncbi:MAG: rhodanese-like domain-containing protein [Candidatus Competibacterales bacterium]|nr:rhodanese-like domain-containing protein [Candidatus Competibacterales bacterium]
MKCFRGLVLATLLAAGAAAQAEVIPVDPAGLQALRERGVPLIDVRTPEEWAQTGVIPGSHRLTFFDAQGRYDARAWLAELRRIAGPGQPVALICHSGNRSGAIAEFLSRKIGYETVYDAEQGMVGWQSQARPVVAMDGECSSDQPC